MRENPQIYNNGRVQPITGADSGTAPGKVDPFNEDAERELLGGILIDNGLLPGIIAKGVTVDTFYIWRFGRTYAAMLQMHEQGQRIAPVTLADRLEAEEIESRDWLLELQQIENTTPSSFAALTCAEIILEKARRRSEIDLQKLALALLDEASRQAYDESRPIELTIEEMIERLVAARKDSIYQNPIISPSSWADMSSAIGPIEWAWSGWLPRGLLTMIVSESGTGKSALTLDIAKVFISGQSWPDGTPFTGQTGNVLWCEAEAAQAINLDRAKKWGLPLDRLLSPLPDPLADIQLDNAEHQRAILTLARREDVVLIVVDSLSGGTARDGNKNKEILVVCKQLAELARDTGKVLILTHHLRKRSILDDVDRITLDRVRDSNTIVQMARVIWALDTPDQEDRDNRRLSVIKSNLARFPEPLGLKMFDTGITFGNAPEPPRKETLQDRAADLLLSLLAKGPIPAEKIQREVEEAGLSWDAAKRAKAKLGIISAKPGGIWHWALAEKGPEDEIPF